MLESNIRDPGLLGFFNRKLHRSMATDHPEGRLAIDDSPSWTLSLDGRYSARIVSASLKFFDVSDQEFRTVGIDSHRIGCHECIGDDARLLVGHASALECSGDKVFESI
jgi:hypothetical protein